MNIEIDKIISLFKKKKFLNAKKLCEKVENNYLNDANFYILYGAVLFESGNINESIEKFNKSISINPNNSDAFYNRGNAFSKIQNFEEAISSFDSSINLKKNNPEALINKGSALLELNNFDEALNNFNKALEIDIDNQSARKNKAYLFEKKGDYEKSIFELNKIFNLDKKNFEIILRLANNYFFLGQYDEALVKYEFANGINSQHPGVLDGLIKVKLITCKWKDIKKNIDELFQSIPKKNLGITPYMASILFDKPDIILKCTEEWVEEKKKKLLNLNFSKKKKISYSGLKNNKIKVAYFSADFNNHAVGYLIAKTLELHDRDKFEIIGFYFGNKTNDETHKRIKKSFDKYFDVSLTPDKKILKLSSDLEIDIAVDLMGHTRFSRFEIFLRGCAPIQVNFLGYPGTVGTKLMDYIIADKTLIPENMKKFYSEKIIYLPNSYQPNEFEKKIVNKNLSKKDFGLPEDKFIFCCFNTHQKITPLIFKDWCEILKKSPKSILWLLENNEFSTKNIFQEASKRGIDYKRIFFAKRSNIKEHLARLQFADLFLDTFPYTAHTTCSDALRVGTPVLTRIGSTFPSRVAASLLKTSGLEELITHSEDEYIKKAILISRDIKYQRKLKKKVLEAKNIKPLFNNNLYVKNLEKAYEKMYKRKIDNLEPDHIYIT